MPRARSRRPSLQDSKPPPRRKKKPPGRFAELWFRITTRFRAVGYGARELAGRLADRTAHGRERAGELTGIDVPRIPPRAAAVSAVVLVLVLAWLIPAPGLPCALTRAHDCGRAPDRALALAPANSMLFAAVDLDSSSAQYKRGSELVDAFPHSGALLQEAMSLLPAPAVSDLSFQRDIAPWASQEAALIVVPGGGRGDTALVIGTDDVAAAETFARRAGGAEPSVAAQDGVALDLYPDDFTTALVDGFLVLGDDAAVRAIASARAGGAPSLAADPTASAVRDELPGEAAADIYVSGSGARALFGDSSGVIGQLDTLFDFRATAGFGIAVVAGDDGIGIDTFSALDPTLAAAHPSPVAAFPQFTPSLTGEASPRALAYLGVGELGPGLVRLLTSAGARDSVLGSTLDHLIGGLQAQLGTNGFNDLLGALGGEAALIAEPTKGVPFASLVVDDVDEERAHTALADLEAPLRAAYGPADGSGPAFEQTTIGTVQARSLQISPSVHLTYAVFAGKLVISTDPAGIAQVVASGDDLGDSDSFGSATASTPDRVSALLFVNADEVLDLAERLGRAEDPLYAALRADIRRFHALAMGVNADSGSIRAHLFVAVS